jgi:hypothetical protein
MTIGTGTTIFFAVCAAGCVGALFLYMSRRVDVKRRWHRRIVFGAAAFFLAYVAAFYSPGALFGVLPAVGLVVWLLLQQIRFCPACGQPMSRPTPWVALNYCSKCGVRFRQRA